jgi:glycopeptide antibiotics resistance protein
LPLSIFWERDPYRDSLVPGIIAPIANFILFIPLGFLVGVRWRLFDRLSTVLVLAATLSLAIESIQFGLGGHDSSIDDFLLNILGAMFGHGLMGIVVSGIAPACGAKQASWKVNEGGKRPRIPNPDVPGRSAVPPPPQ